MGIENRKKVEAYILESVQSLTPSSTANKDIYAERFKGMSDVEFSRFIERLGTGEEILMIISPNHEKDGLSLSNNFKVADKIGHNFMTKILVSGKDGLPDHLTPIEFMVIDLPVKRLSQTSDKKIRVPKSTKIIDALTGQVTGESKGAALSAPEVQVLSAMGLEAPLIESMKYRGGDRQGRAALNGLMAKYGSVSLKTLEKYQSGVESTHSVRTYLTSAHLKNNL